MMPRPSRGQVWLADFDPVTGHEQGGVRPALIVSTDVFNHGPAEMAFLIPITTRDKRVRWQVPIRPPEGGLNRPSFLKCDDTRSLSVRRLIRPLGAVRPPTMAQVEDRLRILLQV